MISNRFQNLFYSAHRDFAEHFIILNICFEFKSVLLNLFVRNI